MASLLGRQTRTAAFGRPPPPALRSLLKGLESFFCMPSLIHVSRVNARRTKACAFGLRAVPLRYALLGMAESIAQPLFVPPEKESAMIPLAALVQNSEARRMA